MTISRRLPHTPAQGATTPRGHDDTPRPACRNYPQVFDTLQKGPRGNAKFDEAREAATHMCGACKLRPTCHRENADETWMLALAGKIKQPPTVRDTCGKVAGYSAHMKAGEHACPPCRKANAARVAQRKAAGKVMSPPKVAALDKGRAVFQENNRKRNADRLTNLQELIAEGAVLAEVCARLDVKPDTLWKWCRRHGHGDLWFKINPPKPEPIVRRRRGKRAA